jgi:hypothetical protein
VCWDISFIIILIYRAHQGIYTKASKYLQRSFSGQEPRSSLLQTPGIISPPFFNHHLVLLAVHGLNILVGQNGVVVDLVLLDTDVRISVGIKLSGLVCEVEVDGVGPGECEEDQWDAHGVSGADSVRHVAQDDWDDCTTANRRNQERRTPLGVTT